MGEKKRGRWSKEQKFKIAFAAAKGDKTIAQIAEEYQVHPNQIGEWKKQLLENGSEIFASKAISSDALANKEREECFRTIGSQAIKIEWLKKKLGITHSRSVEI